MTNSDASTPQVEVVKKWLEAYFSLDIKGVEPLLSKNYQYEAFNGITDHAKFDNAGRIATSQALLSGLTKSEVSIQQRRAFFNSTD